MKPASERLSARDEPQEVDPRMAWGSDVAAQVLRRLDIPYIALNPGASYRGLHDSLVNHLGNRAPEIIMCLHEEHAVAIAHGYAKATGRPMAVALHSNVGLMHGTMAIYNAWCDRAPMLILGATGPVDAVLRRPWIDWIHTSQDQGGLVRNFVKWDDQPGSAAAPSRPHTLMASREPIAGRVRVTGPALAGVKSTRPGRAGRPCFSSPLAIRAGARTNRSTTASALRTPAQIARTDMVAPVTFRMSRLMRSGSSSDLPTSCRLKRLRAISPPRDSR